MENIQVTKTKLLAKLKENRAEHRKIFEEALEGYRKRVIQEFARRLDDARKGRSIDVSIRITQPVDHTDDYDNAIAMLEMDLGKTVTLAEHDFRQYVMDQWGWSDNFYLSNSAYSGTAAASPKFKGLKR